MRTFTFDELIEVDGKFVEKEWAFPNLEGAQTAVMLNRVNGKWELSLWGAAVDSTGTEACGWEPCCQGDRPIILTQVATLMKEIEKDEN